MKYLTIASIIIAIALMGGAIFLFRSGSADLSGEISNIQIVDGQQIIEIGARGGYNPRVTIAKADMPTIIKMKTQGTFDCSSALVIPALNYRANLQPSGTTEITVPPQKAGTTLQGLCAMGMYSFQIKFN